MISEKLTLEIPTEIPDFLRDKLEEGDMLLYAKSLHNKFLPEPWQSKLAKDSVGNPVLYRHKSPENPEDRGDVFGRNLHEEVKDDGFSHTYYRIFGGKPDGPELKLQKLIKKQLEAGDPIGLSKGFITKSENGEIYRVIALEDSITYKPACSQCTTQEVLIQMENKEKLEEEIKKLQKELDNHKLQLESKDKELTNTQKIKSEFETRLKELEGKVEAEEKAVVATKTEKEQLEDKLIKLSDEFVAFQKKVELEREISVKQPVINKLYELEKDADLVEVYKSWDIKKLEDRLVKKEAEDRARKDKLKSVIIVTSLEKDKETMKTQLSEKDIGMSALRSLDGNEKVIALEIEKQMKNEGLIR